MVAVVEHALKRPPRAKRRVRVSQAVAKARPHWDVDLHSVEHIDQLCLTVTPGETLRDVTVLVSTQHFDAGAKVVWSRRLEGALTDSVIAKIGTIGRYIRIEAAHLALEEVDVLLPDPSDALPEGELHDVLTMSGAVWDAASDEDQRDMSQPAQVGQTFDLSHPAGSRFRVAFDLPGNAMGGSLFVWWNGAMVAPKGYTIRDRSRRVSFDVITTGAVDKLTFRGTAAEISAQNISIDRMPEDPKVAKVRPTTAASPENGTIQGVLRRPVPVKVQSSVMAQKAMALLGFSEGEDIIFR